ncbi:MAG TPA: AraC family transcriptional regulator [Blastocatellia bacterium]|nr:AraC family transcriptional regulator [Blastocatellia bacterium]
MNLTNAQLHSVFTFSQSVTWPEVSLKHWRARRGQMPECSFNEHQIGIALTGGTITHKQTATGNQQSTLRTRGHMCLVPSGQPVSLDFAGETEALSIFIAPSLISRAAADLFVPDRLELTEVHDKDDPLIRHIGLTLMTEAEATEPAGRLYVDSLIQTLALHLVRHYTVEGRQAPAFNGGLPGHRLRRAKEFMHENLADDLTLEEIAEAVGLSPFHFARSFKRATGQTPQQYLWQIRIDHAKRLLADSELPIVDVSANVGFKNQSHFTTTFRRFTSMTPKAWRDAVLR